MNCPRCDHDLEVKKVELAPEDVQEYIRSILGSRPFSKLYKLFNGSVSVTFDSLTVAMSNHVVSLFNEIDNGDGVDKTETKTKIRLILYTRALNGLVFDPIDDLLDVDFLLKRYDEVLGDKPEGVKDILIKALAHFLTLNTKLSEEGFDSNFWQAAGPR